MGYSIAAPVMSPKAKHAMLAFLSDNFDRLGDEYFHGPTDKLAYDHHSCHIGFDGTTTSDYMISVCAWIVLKVGKPKMFPTKKIKDVYGPYKYLRYDGIDEWPLLITQEFRNRVSPSLVQIDWAGCLVPRPGVWNRRAREKEARRIHDELARLDVLWNRKGDIEYR